ncbi:MAG: FHIPEP family type III secretion protein, partial [Gemmatimonadales bacterium]
MYDPALKNLKEAETGFRLVSVETGVTESLLEQMKVMLAQNEDEGARTLQRQIEVSSSDPGVHLKIGEVWADFDRPSSAKAAFQQAVQLQPKNPEAHRRLTETTLKLGEYEPGLRALAAWTTVDTISVEAYLESNVLDRLPPERQRAMLDLAVATFPDSAELAIWLGGRLWAEGREADAEEQFTRAKDLPVADGRFANALHRHVLDGLDDLSQERVLRLLDRLYGGPPELCAQLFEVLWRLANTSRALDHRVPTAERTESERITGEHHLSSAAARPTPPSSPPTPAPGLELSTLERLRLLAHQTSSAESAIPAVQDTRRQGTPVITQAMDENRRREAIGYLAQACARLEQGDPELRARRAQDLTAWRLRCAEALLDIAEWPQAETLAALVLQEDPGNRRATQLSDRIRFRRSWARVGSPEEPPPITVEVATNLERWVGGSVEGQVLVHQMLPALRAKLRERIGFDVPPVRVRPNSEFGPGVVVILIREIPCFQTKLEAEYLAAGTPDQSAGGVTPQSARLPWEPEAEGYWLTEADLTSIQSPPAVVWDPRGVIVGCLATVLTERAADLLSVDEVARLVDQLGADTSGTPVNLGRLTAVLRSLLHERVPVSNLSSIARTVSEAAPGTALGAVVEAVRSAIIPDLLRPLLDPEGRLPAADTPPRVEQLMAEAGRVEMLGEWRYCAMEPQQVQQVLTALREELALRPARALVLSDARLRPHLRAIAELEFPELAVLAPTEAAGVPRV